MELVLGGVDGLGLTGLRNLDTVADASVTNRRGRWWMVLGGLVRGERAVQLHAAELPAGAELTDPRWRITTEPDDPKLAARLAPAPPAGGWDATGYHCPSYVAGHGRDGRVVERIYYASSESWESFLGPYRIGFLEWDGGAWVRHPEPVFVGEEPWERGSVLEPNVLYRDGRWLLSYTAGVGQGVRSAAGSAESADGVGGWQRTGTPQEDRFDAQVIRDGHGFARVTSRHPLDAKFTATDGIWLAHGTDPAGPWPAERQLVQSADGTPWHDAGVWKPCAVTDRDGLVVFFNGSQRTDSPFLGALGIGVVRVDPPGAPSGAA